MTVPDALMQIKPLPPKPEGTQKDFAVWAARVWDARQDCASKINKIRELQQ